MRIEGPASQNPVSPEYKVSPPGKTFCNSTLCSTGASATFLKAFSYAWNKIVLFFKQIFSYFFPKNRSPNTVNGKPIPQDATIGFFKVSEENGMVTYRLNLNDDPTENEIKFIRGQNNTLSISYINFPDQAMRKNIGNMLKQILKSEEATCFHTENLGNGMKLFDAGFISRTTVHYDTKQDTSENTNLKRIIEAARSNKPNLSDAPKAALARLEAILNPAEHADFLTRSWVSITSATPATAFDLPINDFMILLKEIKIGDLRIVRFTTPLKFELG